MLKLLIAERGDDREIFRESLAGICRQGAVSADYTDSPGQADTLFRKNPCRYDAVFFSVAPESGNPSAAAETAEKMQKLNPYLQIILMTTYDYLPLSILECGNIRLLKKPLELPRLSRLVSDLRKNAAALAAGGQKLLVLKFNREYTYLASESVIYVYKCRNGIVIVTEDGERIHSGRLDDFEKQLTWTFCRCHSSFIVNFRHVVQSGTDYILMDNAHRISVSRAYRKKVERFIEKLGAVAEKEKKSKNQQEEGARQELP